MGLCNKISRLLFLRVLPVVALAVAVFIGWLGQQPCPEGALLATIFPLMGGYPPPPLTGGWATPGTPEVPEGLLPAPRPHGELFLRMPDGSKMPANGLGMCCRPTAYDPETVRRTILWYLLQGGRHIDDADAYWNHKAVGQGIRDAIARGVPRSEIFLTTKIMPRLYGRKATEAAVQRFLEELGLDYIDMLLMHMPANPLGKVGECSDKSYKDCRLETWQALSGLRKQGKLRNIGVSNFNVKQMKELLELNAAPIATNQISYNPWIPDWLHEATSFCHEHAIAVTAYASLGGFMTKAQTETVATLKELSSGHNKSVAQILLKWALQKNVTVIPGTGNPKHMRENLDVYSFQLLDAEMARLDALRTDASGKAFFFLDEDQT